MNHHPFSFHLAVAFRGVLFVLATVACAIVAPSLAEAQNSDPPVEFQVSALPESDGGTLPGAEGVVPPVPDLPEVESGSVAACHDCFGYCYYPGSIGGTACDPAGNDRGPDYGRTQCSVRIVQNGPFVHCVCQASGGYCSVSALLNPVDRAVLEQEAVETVANGGMLAADGPFFVALRSGETVIRWKCNGDIVGPLVTGSHTVLGE